MRLKRSFNNKQSQSIDYFKQQIFINYTVNKKDLKAVLIVQKKLSCKQVNFHAFSISILKNQIKILFALHNSFKNKNRLQKKKISRLKANLYWGQSLFSGLKSADMLYC